MSRSIRILLADDHAILRDGIRSLLGDEPDMQVIGEAEDGRAAIEQTRKLHPDVVLMDIAMPLLNGLEATRQIRHECPDTRVLILTMHDNEEYIPQVLEAGGAGYVLKHAAAQEMVSAIRAVAEGGAYFSPAIARSLADSFVERLGATNSHDPYHDLTPRERELLQLIAEGHTNRQIAEMLVVSIKTVKTHRLHLMQKLGMHDRGELIKYAIHKGIINPD